MRCTEKLGLQHFLLSRPALLCRCSPYCPTVSSLTVQTSLTVWSITGLDCRCKYLPDETARVRVLSWPACLVLSRNSPLSPPDCLNLIISHQSVSQSTVKFSLPWCTSLLKEVLDRFALCLKDIPSVRQSESRLSVVSCRDESPPRTGGHLALSDLSWEGESSVITERFTNTQYLH